MAIIYLWIAVGLLAVALMFLASYTLELGEQLLTIRRDMANQHDDLIHKQTALGLMFREHLKKLAAGEYGN